jgi:hypothetical protein
MRRSIWLFVLYFLLPVREGLVQSISFGQVADTVCSGQRTLVAVSCGDPGPYCGSHSAPQVSFDSDDSLFFVSWQGGRCVNIYCAAQAMGKLIVTGTLEFSSFPFSPGDSCPTVQQRFEMQIVVRECLSNETENDHFRESISIIPNPFTLEHPFLAFSISQSASIGIELYDLTGCLVRQIERDVPAGTSEIDLGMSRLPAGCYWYVVRAGDFSKSGKVMKLP